MFSRWSCTYPPNQHSFNRNFPANTRSPFPISQATVIFYLNKQSMKEIQRTYLLANIVAVTPEPRLYCFLFKWLNRISVVDYFWVLSGKIIFLSQYHVWEKGYVVTHTQTLLHPFSFLFLLFNCFSDGSISLNLTRVRRCRLRENLLCLYFKCFCLFHPSPISLWRRV